MARVAVAEHRLAAMVESVDQAFAAYRFDLAAQALYVACGYARNDAYFLYTLTLEATMVVEGGAGEFPGALGVVFGGAGLLGVGEGASDAGAHFAGGLAGEGDGDDGLGVVDGGEEGEEALGEEFGFAGAGGGLDEEGGGDVEGAFAGSGIRGEHCGFRVALRCLERRGEGGEFVTPLADELVDRLAALIRQFLTN